MPTLGELQQDVRNHLDEDTARFWTDPELDRWIFEAMRDVARRAEILPDIFKIDVIASKEHYDLPKDFLRVHRVEYRQDSTNSWSLEYRPIMELDDMWGRSSRSTGQPNFYTIWGSSNGSQQLRLYPLGSDSIAGGLLLYYYRLPREPKEAGDTIDLPSGWTDLIPLYVEVVARRKDNDGRWKDAYNLYNERLDQMMRVTRLPTDSETFISSGGLLGDWDY